ncbi:hypothetical protein SRHO_G00246420 [Serrasalmus rhombeus]
MRKIYLLKPKTVANGNRIHGSIPLHSHRESLQLPFYRDPLLRMEAAETQDGGGPLSNLEQTWLHALRHGVTLRYL